jgi:hypothetical protein
LSALPRRPQGNRSTPIPAAPRQFCRPVSGRASCAPGSTAVLLRWRRDAPSRSGRAAPRSPPLLPRRPPKPRQRRARCGFSRLRLVLTDQKDRSRRAPVLTALKKSQDRPPKRSRSPGPSAARANACFHSGNWMARRYRRKLRSTA